jgi:hypothetical protein
MSLLHGLAAHGVGGVTGMQSQQRDWSPFVAHFTSYRAMGKLRSAIGSRAAPADIANYFVDADSASFEIVKQIAASNTLRRSVPSEKDDIPACVCFSEYSLPGLVAHCERYGRFGWVFRKSDIFGCGARPCIYVDSDVYAEISRGGRGLTTASSAGLLFGLANVYRPVGHGQIQDFTHEREWRLFSDVGLRELKPEVLIAPKAYAQRFSALFPNMSAVVPIDTAFEWGV